MRRIRDGRQRVRIFQEADQPGALDRTSLPGQFRRHVAATPVDLVATEAAHVVDELTGFAGGPVVGRCASRYAQRDGQRLRQLGLCEQCRRQRVYLLGARVYCGIFNAFPNDLGWRILAPM